MASPVDDNCTDLILIPIQKETVSSFNGRRIGWLTVSGTANILGTAILLSTPFFIMAGGLSLFTASIFISAPILCFAVPMTILFFLTMGSIAQQHADALLLYTPRIL